MFESIKDLLILKMILFIKMCHSNIATFNFLNLLNALYLKN